MKKSKLRKITGNKCLFIVIILLVVAPLLINVGLAVTDIINDKWGIALTAEELSNESWLDFWKNYMSTAIAFFGVYLVWDTSNRDRKTRENKESSDHYLDSISKEEKTLVEVASCFNTGIIFKALNQLGGATVQECKAVLQSARDKMDEAQVKFELLTDILDDFERCSGCEYNPCIDKKMKQEIKKMFYSMEQHYIEMLNSGDEYLKKVDEEQRNLNMKTNQMQIIDNIKIRISYLQQAGSFYGDLLQKQEELLNAEKLLDELNKTKLSREEMENMIQSAQKEIDYLSIERAKFIGYCKSYINLKKEHARDLKKDGVIKYVKVNENSK